MRIKLKENFRAIFYAPYYATQAFEPFASMAERDGVSKHRDAFSWR